MDLFVVTHEIGCIVLPIALLVFVVVCTSPS